MVKLPVVLNRCTARRVSRLLPVSIVAVALALAGPSPAVLQAQTNGTTPGAIRTYSTIASIGIEWALTGDANHNASASVDYRVTGTTAWRAAMPLVRVDYNGANMLVRRRPISSATWYRFISRPDPVGHSIVNSLPKYV